MQRTILWLCVGTLLLGTGVPILAQQPAAVGSTNQNAVVPPLVSFSGALNDVNNKPLTGVVGVTFALYKDQQGGAPLWLETQNVYPDKTGRYTVNLGSTKSTGLPSDIFVAGEARWLGVQAAGQAEQPRVLLLSVPYALKAGDAETVGGLPVSAFVLAAPPASGTAGPKTSVQPLVTGTTPVTTAGGTVNQMPLWDSTSDITSSVITQTGSGTTAKIGIGTTTPASTLDVKGGATIRGTAAVQGALTLSATGTATASGGKNSQAENFVASVFNGTTSTAVNQKFQWMAEPVANNTANATGTLNLLYASGTATAAETGLKIAPNGQMTFAAGQTFPGTGTGNGSVTGVGLTAPSTDFLVTGSPVTTNGTLGLGWITAPDYNNTPNAIVKRDNSGNFSGSTINAANGFNLAGTAFAFGSVANSNAFLGFAGNTTTTGGFNTGLGPNALAVNAGGMRNTATGMEALYANTDGIDNTGTGTAALIANTTGNDNTATGWVALNFNTTGGFNTAMGSNALATNTTGSYDTALGAYADAGSNNLTNATAIGAQAQVTQNNSLVLGSINGVNGATSDTKVGIGTTAPAATLDVHGTGNFTGPITFAAGQTFPGMGTITGVTAGSGLSGGGSSGSVTLANTGLLSLSAGTGITSTGGQTPTIGINTSTVPQLSAANTFTGNQTVNGNLSATGMVTGSAFNIGSNLFAFGSYSSENAFLGFSGNTTTTGSWNTANGIYALASDTSGYGNTATGASTLHSNTTGTGNTATGTSALYQNNGNFNTATGYSALEENTAGYANTATGFQALNFNSTGTNNTAVGADALYSSTDASNNTAVGYDALQKNTGGANTATGASALNVNTTGIRNTANGLGALNHNTTGSYNTGIGYTAMYGTTTGSYNTGLGYSASPATGTVSNATAIGAFAQVSQSNSLVLGSINGVNGATASANVGIGTTTPSYTLDVRGTGFFAQSTTNGYGIYAYDDSSGGIGVYGRGAAYSAYFPGNVYVGNLSKNSGSFKIDHPLDPANKYLYHSFVESPDMMNIYNGNVVTDKRGMATLELPDWFEALNRDFRYQLTVMGQFAQAIVVQKVKNNHFTIKTSKPGVEVSWQVTGIRQDAYANAHRIPTEEVKPPQEQGRYLHPELFGAGPEKAIGVRPPEPPKGDPAQTTALAH